MGKRKIRTNRKDLQLCKNKTEKEQKTNSEIKLGYNNKAKIFPPENPCYIFKPYKGFPRVIKDHLKKKNNLFDPKL